ncbi:MAG: hypothetical protein V1898_00805 [Patescibacteria group bacterium]
MNLKNNFSWLLIIIISVGLWTWLEASPTLGDPDAFYHAGISTLMNDHLVLADFPWLDQTLLKDRFTDQHFLYHVLLVMLNKLFTPLISVKIATVIGCALFITFIYLFLREKKVKSAWLYIGLLLITAPFIVRLAIPKATPWALLCLFLGMYFWERKKPLALFGITFIYVWLHGGFILLPISAFIFWIVQNIFNYVKKEKNNFIAWQKWFALSGGLISGLIINPYFPSNIFFYWQQIVNIGLINYKNAVDVGAEWYGYSLPDFIGGTSLLWLLIISAIIMAVFIRHEQKVNNYQWGFLAIIFFIATLKSRRYVEYFVPIALIWSALEINLFLTTNASTKFIQYLKIQYQKHNTKIKILVVYLFIAILSSVVISLRDAKQYMVNSMRQDQFLAAGKYLQEHTPRGSLVFHTSWDDWPMLFYYAPNNYFLVGMDPTFMYKKDLVKYKLWRDISDGKIKSSLAEIISREFSCRYMIIDKTDEDSKLFWAYLIRDKNIKVIYNDEEVIIYEIQQ